ncbi:MAG TPA: hypothetical protein PLU52_07265 [Opitutaceae bacterium]|nr:hypothetical protein [Opitutaceae bacterium]
MKIQCIYCQHIWECDERPPACPSCATKFSLTITPDTPLRKIVRSLRANGRTLSIDLRARLPERHPEHMDVALACAPEPDTEPRAAAYRLEAGDSPCPVHGDDDP